MSSRAFLRRLLIFVTPLVLVAGFSAFSMARTGELLPVRWIASLHANDRPMLYLPEFSDHLYRYKVEVARRVRPDMLVIGSSRSNQWRAAMFGEASFYNAGNSIYLPIDLSSVLDELGDYTPRIVLFSLDDFMFNQRFAEDVRQRSKGEFGGITSAEFRHVAAKVLQRFYDRPSLLYSSYREPVHGLTALGFSALDMGLGFRPDGTVQYGDVIRGGSRQKPEDAAANIAGNRQWPGYGADRLDPSLMRDLETFAETARRRGIKLIAVTPGIHPSIVKELRASPAHVSWRQFRSAETATWLRNLNILHFDFTDIASYGGHTDEFIDGFHPSEPAYFRMVQVMLSDTRFRAMFPSADSGAIASTLAKATRFEAIGSGHISGTPK